MYIIYVYMYIYYIYIDTSIYIYLKSFILIKIPNCLLVATLLVGDNFCTCYLYHIKLLQFFPYSDSKWTKFQWFSVIIKIMVEKKTTITFHGFVILFYRLNFFAFEIVQTNLGLRDFLFQ